jgi:uncharacterized protein (TIGR02147 family)
MQDVMSLYRQMLKNELEERCRKNQDYSLRAFAKALSLNPSQLSRVINGTQNLSLGMAQSVAERAFRSKRERLLFSAAVELAIARRPSLRQEALKKVSRWLDPESPANLSLEAMVVIAEWHHFAILDLVSLPQIPHTAAAIAAYLGVSQIETKLAIERLLKLGLLTKDGERLRKTTAVLQTPTDLSSAALRRHHRPKYKDLITEFMRAVGELSRSCSKEPDGLYQLNVQLFDLKNQESKQ